MYQTLTLRGIGRAAPAGPTPYHCPSFAKHFARLPKLVGPYQSTVEREYEGVYEKGLKSFIPGSDKCQLAIEALG